MKTISVIGLKGGSGKTSTTVPLACEAAKSGTTVVLDLDETPSATEWIDAAELTSDRLVGHQLPLEELRPTLDELRGSGAVDWVLIDTPPGRKEEAACLAAAQAADLVIVPSHIGSGDVAQLVQTLDLLAGLPRRVPVLIVLNHASTMPAQTRATRQAIEGVEEVQALGARVAQMAIPFNVRYLNAKGNRPTVDWWHFGELWREVRAML